MSIHSEGVLSGKRVASLGAWLVLSGMLLLPGHGIAQLVTLTDAGSAATVDLGSSAGMNNWNVLGQNQLMQQWFWYRTDNGIAQPINTIGGLQYQVTGNNTLDAYYQNDQLSIEIVYKLTGGGVGSGNADVAENISIVNNTGSGLNFNFYQYSDFNLLGSGANDTVQIFGNPGSFNYAQQTSGGTGIGEVIVAPSANHGEAAYAGQTLAKLNGTANLTLNDNTDAGPGDVTWALQWGDTIGAGQEYDISKDKSLRIEVIPEPSTLALIALGAGALGLARRRKLS